MRRIVDAVDENSAVDRFAIDGCVDFGIVCCGDYNEVAVEVGRIELALNPFKLPFGCKLADLRIRFGRDHPQAQSRY